MIIAPKVRGFICLTAHPTGCEQNIIRQIDYTKSKGAIDGPKKVLIIGASTGFGLASRITSAFGSNAATIGVFFEKEPTAGRPGSAGWYNTAAFAAQAQQAGLYAKSINGDAFSKEVKAKTVALIKEDLGKIDLIIYSLASPKRTHPESGETFRSVLKPIGQNFTNKTVDFHSGVVSDVSVDPSTDKEIQDTVTVMGGEDWNMWINELKEADLLAPGVKTIAYSYVGPELTNPFYRNGTIGRAKDNLEATAFEISEQLKDHKGKAYISVNKALVTQASSAIPIIPLYMSLLYKVMKQENIHEGCIEQIQRLFRDRLYEGDLQLDDKERIRIDDWEMREDIQERVTKLWNNVTTDNIEELSDLEGYRKDFFNLFGFDVDGVDYTADVNEMLEIEGLV